MRISGQWPNPIALSRGWSRAHARPWNRNRNDAYLRLIRGGTPFLSAATARVLELGPSAAISPPLLAGSQQTWQAAGYQHYTSLRLLRKAIGEETPPLDDVVELNNPPWARIVQIDGAAFGAYWQAELPALHEALKSTPTTTLLGVGEPDKRDGLAGYAIVGVTGISGYLQRLAVAPEYQRQGLGRSLTRACLNWSRRRGARQLILNTKPDNRAAQQLYISEGFELLPDRLELLRYGDSVSP